jgi:hypothetical protein
MPLQKTPSSQVSSLLHSTVKQAPAFSAQIVPSGQGGSPGMQVDCGLQISAPLQNRPSLQSSSISQVVPVWATDSEAKPKKRIRRAALGTVCINFPLIRHNTPD